MKKLYLDDIRIPKTEGWDIVRNYDEFTAWIKLNGLPDVISFDHDLADIHYDPSTWTQSFTYLEKTGLDCAKWLVWYCIDNKLKLPTYFCHSANPVGKENILKLLRNYEKTYSLD